MLHPALVIDPFDSDHFLYGTGATIYGSHDLTNVGSTPSLEVSPQLLQS